MEQLLEDVPPPRDKVFDDLSKELREGQICSVLLGSAETSHGIFRLLKALRHEVPFVGATAKRLGADKTLSCAFVAKTFHTAHGGKLSLARIFAGTFADGTTVYGGANDDRTSGIFTLMGQEPVKRGEAKTGDTVAFGRLDSVKTGDTLSEEKDSKLKIENGAIVQPVFGLAIAAKEKKDEVKLTAAITKIIEEDPSISLTHSQDRARCICASRLSG
jgi:elongation factor G